MPSSKTHAPEKGPFLAHKALSPARLGPGFRFRFGLALVSKLALQQYLSAILPHLPIVLHSSKFVDEVLVLARALLSSAAVLSVSDLAAHPSCCPHGSRSVSSEDKASMEPFLSPDIHPPLNSPHRCPISTSHMASAGLQSMQNDLNLASALAWYDNLPALWPCVAGLFDNQQKVVEGTSAQCLGVYAGLVAATSAAVYFVLSQPRNRPRWPVGELAWCGLCRRGTGRPLKGADDVDKASPLPDHLVILVHGIGGSPANWKYMEAQFKLRSSPNIIVHLSKSNSFLKTFDGVDVMGDRLRDEVLEVVAQNPHVKKISFVCHSMGGLVGRYAIGKMYAPPGEEVEAADESTKQTVKGRVLGMLGLKADGRDNAPLPESEGVARHTGDMVPNDQNDKATQHSPGPSRDVCDRPTGNGVSSSGNLPSGVDKDEERSQLAGKHEGGHKTDGLQTTVHGKVVHGPHDSGRTEVSNNIHESVAMMIRATGRGRLPSKRGATVAGLEPVNFVTIATPHLGCLGSGHLPFLLQVGFLERASPTVAPAIVGRTGKHLFLADGPPPLLQKMCTNTEEGSFLSALKSFKQRTAYANIGGDQMVGWRTASIRRATEMPVLPEEEVDPRYRHVMMVEHPPTMGNGEPAVEFADGDESFMGENLANGDGSMNGERFTLDESTNGEEANGGKKRVHKLPALGKMEDDMVTALQQMPWKRVDVSFHKSRLSWMAHNLIQVKSSWLHSDGASVIWHVIDHLEP